MNTYWNHNPAKTSFIDESNVGVKGVFVFKIRGSNEIELPPTSALPTLCESFLLHAYFVTCSTRIFGWCVGMLLKSCIDRCTEHRNKLHVVMLLKAL